jgi:hypothetical protein
MHAEPGPSVAGDESEQPLLLLRSGEWMFYIDERYLKEFKPDFSVKKIAEGKYLLDESSWNPSGIYR